MTRALVLTGPGELRIEERAVREPGPGEAAVSVIATGICGSDVHGAAGHTGRRHAGQVMGHETVGRVRAVGDRADGSLEGVLVAVDPVVSCGVCAECADGAPQHCGTGWVLGVRPDVDGAFADEIVVPIGNLVALPESMPEWHGASVEPLAVGFHAVRRGETTADDRVLVIGGGPIGQAIALAARRVGAASVLVSEPDDARAGLVERLGFARTTPDRLDDDVRDVLGGPATVAFDAVGVEASVVAAFRSTRARARVVLVGMDSPRLAFPAYELTARERVLVGSICYGREDFRSTAAWAAAHPEILAMLSDRRVPLADGPELFAGLLAGEVRANKILLVP